MANHKPCQVDSIYYNKYEHVWDRQVYGHYARLQYTVVSRKRAQYQISAHPRILLQFPVKVYSKKHPPNSLRAESPQDARLVYGYTEIM